mmetsp:Transcript_26949/g.68517  ORF Transcript_26949/g.68517 Transcript_26949/m.68517 type:complete len:259 (-) Transcript_26949:139-915(-)
MAHMPSKSRVVWVGERHCELDRAVPDLVRQQRNPEGLHDAVGLEGQGALHGDEVRAGDGGQVVGGVAHPRFGLQLADAHHFQQHGPIVLRREEDARRELHERWRGRGQSVERRGRSRAGPVQMRPCGSDVDLDRVGADHRIERLWMRFVQLRHDPDLVLFVAVCQEAEHVLPGQRVAVGAQHHFAASRAGSPQAGSCITPHLQALLLVRRTDFLHLGAADVATLLPSRRVVRDLGLHEVDPGREALAAVGSDHAILGP